MATNPFVRNLTASGWRYDANRGGFVRGDTSWNPATRSFSTPNNVGGTIFMSGSPARSAGISGGVQSPALPALVAPAAVVPGSVGVSSVVRANPVTTTAAQWSAPEWDAERFGAQNVRGRDVDPMMVEDTEILRELDRQAQDELALGRSLSAEEERDAQQSARAAFAARGMATGVPAALAEVLNRDAYARERQASRRDFAAGISGMMTGIDQGNQVAYNEVMSRNADRALSAAEGNRAAGLERYLMEGRGTLDTALTNATEANRVALANESNRLQADQANQDAQLRAELANQGAGLEAGRINSGNALDFARLGIEGTLGAFNAGTSRLNALTSARTATSAGGSYAGIPQSMLMDRWQGSQFRSGLAAAGRAVDVPSRVVSSTRMGPATSAGISGGYMDYRYGAGIWRPA